MIPGLVAKYCEENGFIEPFSEQRCQRLIYWAYKPNDIMPTQLLLEYFIEKDRCFINPCCPMRWH